MKQETEKFWYSNFSLLIVGAVVLTSVFGVGYAMNMRHSVLMKEQLRDSLTLAASVGAAQIDGDLLSSIKNKNDMQTEAYGRIMAELKAIREYTASIEYVYIMRRTKDPMVLEFVADVDSLNSFEETDANGNGVIEPDEELSYPGDAYDISEVPAMQGPAFNSPTADQEITYDQWGALISGYAPIYNSQGEVVAILGLDMTAEDYRLQTNQMFSLFSLGAFVSLAIVLAALVMLVFWRRNLAGLEAMHHQRTALVSVALRQIGSPLSILRWWIEILEEKVANKKIEIEGISQIRAGVDQLQHVFDSLQRAHFLNRGELKVELEATSLTELIHLAVASKQLQINQRNQSCVMDVPEEIALMADKHLVVGVIQELLDNACYYSPDGSKITVTGKRSGKHVLISVIDEGKGIPEHELPHVCEGLMRGDDALHFKTSGNGLGLFIAKKIMNQLDGRIVIKSKVNEGTTVSLWLPMQ